MAPLSLRNRIHILLLDKQLRVELARVLLVCLLHPLFKRLHFLEVAHVFDRRARGLSLQARLLRL